MVHRDPEEFLPLSVLSFHVLLALGTAPAHGYAIGKQVERHSGGKLNPTTGSLYQALKRLAEDRLIEQAPEAAAGSSDSRRRYFRLTPLGRRVVALEARRLHELIGLAIERDLYRGSA